MKNSSQTMSVFCKNVQVVHRGIQNRMKRVCCEIRNFNTSLSQSFIFITKMHKKGCLNTLSWNSSVLQCN